MEGEEATPEGYPSSTAFVSRMGQYRSPEWKSRED
jgi:hypothetical protein